jgi:hypothetical protein
MTDILGSEISLTECIKSLSRPILALPQGLLVFLLLQGLGSNLYDQQVLIMLHLSLIKHSNDLYLELIQPS